MPTTVERENKVYMGLDVIREATLEDKINYDFAAKEVANKYNIPLNEDLKDYPTSLFLWIIRNEGNTLSKQVRTEFGEKCDEVFGLPKRLPHSDIYYGCVARPSD